jgi:ligand-binding sensor domain-containing protein
MRTSYRLLCLLCLLLWGGGTAAQVSGPLFHRISLEQGLSDPRVTFITQDKYGFMWFGTNHGLNRYDGYNIKVYEQGTSGLSTNTITSLYCSRAGALYASDANGLWEYNYTSDHFERPKGTGSSVLNLKGHTVWMMAEDSYGRVYLGGPESFIRFTPAKALMEDMNELVHADGAITRISGLTFGKDGRLWITTQKRGFFVVDPANNTWAQLPHDSQYGYDSCCFAVHRSVFIDDTHLLLGQHSNGLSIFDTRSFSFTAQKGFLGMNDTIRFNSVYRLIKDYKGRIWAGTMYFGLVQYLPVTREIIQYKYDPFNPFSYGGYRVNALYEDREHNIWVGTGGYGVYRFHPDENHVRYFPWNPAGGQSPPGPEVLSAAIRDSVSAWIGTDKGPAIFNFRQGTFKALPYSNSYHPSLPGSNINFTYTDKAGKAWFASRSLGITSYDEQRSRFARYHKKEDFLTNARPDQLISKIPGDLVSTIAEHPDGNYIMLINKRIALFDEHKQRSRYGDDDSLEPLLRLKGITDLVRRGDELIIAMQAKEASSVVSYSFVTRQSRLLVRLDTTGKTDINSLQLMPDSSIAIASSNGIYVVQKAGNALKQYSWKEDKAHNNIRGIITGIEGYIWACTDRYIGCVNVQTGKWLWLNSSEGLKLTRLFGDALRLMPNGQILAGSGDGLFLIDPAAAVRERIHKPALVDFRVFNKPIHFALPLQEIKEIRLDHNQNFFSFSMSSLHFSEGGNIEYSYKLEGFDKDWQKAGSDRNAQYTSVPGGRYILRLRARSGVAEWEESPQQIRIIVAKPWWTTWLFRLAVILALLGAVAGIYYNRVRSIRKAAKLRTDYEVRLNELEMSALRTQMNPHFIFNCLNTINSFINSNQKTSANQYITRFAKLIRLILENSRKRRVSLASELEALVLYIQLEQLRFENRFDYTIDLADNVDQDNVEVPPLVLQPFVENSILHGILPKAGNGHIQITITQTDNAICYSIEDNGVGRAAAKRRDEEGVLKKESHGMDITMKRIELFNREYRFTDNVIITDLQSDGFASGTRVQIPLALVEGF